MPLPTGPSNGGLPQRPGGGLPPRPGGGQPNITQRPVAPQQLPDPGPSLPSLPEPQRPTPNDPGFSGMERLSQYDFEAQQVDRAPLSQTPRDEDESYFDNTDDDERARIEEAKARRERETAERFDRSMEEKTPSGKIKKNVLKPQAGELDEKGQNVFVDKKNKKVQPFGGKKSALKVSDLDRRKNMRQNARIVQIAIICVLALTLGFAVKNAFFPPASLTAQDVQGIVYSTTGSTEFPLEQGRYFAQSYMEAFLEYNADDPTSSAVMQYYAQGSLSPGGVVPGVNLGKNFKQEVVYGPTTYRSQAASASSAIYTVGALVKVSNSQPGVTDVPSDSSAEGTAPAGGSTAVTPSSSTTNGALEWKYFSINVYYDKDANSFAIASAPTVVAAPDVLKSADVPKAAPIGTGTAAPEETVKELTPTVYGFLEAYRASDSKNYSKLLPFLGADPDVTLLNGLGGLYDFKGGQADEKSIEIKAYATGTTAVKVIATVTWVQTVAGSVAETQSNYVIDVQPVSGGYHVTRFLPLAYVPGS